MDVAATLWAQTWWLSEKNIDFKISQTQDILGGMVGSVRSGQQCWGWAVYQGRLGVDYD